MINALLLSDDLFVASQVQAALGELATVKQVASSAALDQESSDSDVALVLIDLTARSAGDLTFIECLRAKASGTRLVAFGPHVQVGRLKMAENAGCDLVLSRGQLMRDGARLVGELYRDK